MKINAYLENCRTNICNAIRQIQTDVERHGQPCSDNRRDLIQALTELDAFRHGALQKCSQCGYVESGCGDCDPCIGGRPDQCAVGGIGMLCCPDCGRSDNHTHPEGL